MPQKLINLAFPVAGLNRRVGFQNQPPWTTPAALNVWPDDAIAGRERGGRRPGLSKVFEEQLDGQVNLLTQLSYVDATGRRNSRTVAAAGGLLYLEDATGHLVAVTTTLRLAGDVQLSAAELFGKLYIADYASDPLAAADGATDGAGTALTSTAIGNFELLGVNALDYVVVITAGTGATAGTYAISTVSGATVTLSTSAGAGASDIQFRVERAVKVFDPVAGTLSILAPASGTVPHGCQLVAAYRQRLVLARGGGSLRAFYLSRQGDVGDFDYGQTDDQRAVAGTPENGGALSEDLTALIPHGDQCLLLAGAASFWTMRNDPAYQGSIDNLSWDIGCVGPQAWTHGPLGSQNENNWLWFLSHDGVYLMPPGCGDPPMSVSGERLPRELQLSAEEVAQHHISMTYDPRRRGVLLTVTPGDSGQGQAWMIRTSGARPGVQMGFWPTEFPWWCQGWAAFSRRIPGLAGSPMFIGGRDGWIRRLDELAADDDGTPIAAHVALGPLRLGENPLTEGKIVRLDATLCEGSVPVHWDLQVGDSHERALGVPAFDGGAFDGPGRQFTARPRARGAAAAIVLWTDGTSDQGPWSIEELSLVVERAGTRRRLA